jgi:hypothetical protein
MRKLSWMAVIVVAGGGLIGVTRFTGMWGRGDEAEHAGGGVTSQWQSFEVPGQYDGVVDLKAVADGGIRALPRSRMALEPEETETIVLQGVEPVGTTAMDRTAAATASSTFGDMEDLQREGFADSVEDAVYVEPVAAAEPDVMFEPEEMMPEPEPMAAEDPYMDVEPAMAESEYAAMDTYGEMDYMTAADMELDVEAEMGYAREEFVEYPTVVEAQEVDMRGGEMVATMSVMGAAEGAEDWPPQSYDPEPTHTYVVSPPLAWADEREPVALPRLAGERVVARPQQTDTRERGGLRGVIDVSYVSRFIWRGYDVYANNHSAFQPSIDLDLFGTGFGLNVWMSRANGSGFEDSEWLAYTAYYKGAFFVDEAYATHYKIGYTYFSYPDTPRAGNPLLPGTGDAQEIFGEFYWPNLLPGGIVPSYATFAYWPSESKSTVRNNGGWAHIFGLTKDISFEAIFGNQPEQVVHLGAHVVYNDAFGMAGKAADHDWSHAVFSASTDFDLGSGFMFVPGFYYQSSWDDSVNTSDEYWTSLSLRYSF